MASPLSYSSPPDDTIQRVAEEDQRMLRDAVRALEKASADMQQRRNQRRAERKTTPHKKSTA